MVSCPSARDGLEPFEHESLPQPRHETRCNEMVSCPSARDGLEPFGHETLPQPRHETVGNDFENLDGLHVGDNYYPGVDESWIN